MSNLDAADLRKRAEAKAVQSPRESGPLSPAAAEVLLHELRVHQIQLEMQNEELRRAQAELDDARARYFDLYDLAPVGYVTVSETGLILETNLTLLTLLGVPRGALAGRLFSQFIVKDDVDSFYLCRKKLFATGTPQACELRLVKSDGTVFWAHLAATVAQDADGKPVSRIVLSDINESKQADVYRDMSLKVLQILNGTEGPHDAIRSVLAFVKTQTGTDAVGLRLQDGEDFPYFAQQGFTEGFLLTENSLAERGPDGGVCRDKDGRVCLECTCGLVISGRTDPANPLFTPGGSCWTNDSAPLLDLPPEQDPRHHPRNECVHQGYASVALIPIRDKERIVGLLHLNAHRKGCFTLATVKVLEDLASHIGETLMRKRAEDGLRASEATFRALTENLQVGIVVHAPDTSIRVSNPKASEILGLTSEQMRGKTAIDPAWCFIREDGTKLPLAEYPVSQALGAGVPDFGLVLGVVRQDRQSPIWVECFARKIWNPAGDLDQVIITFADITARRNAEAAAREAAQMIEGIVSALPVRVFWKDRQLAYLGCNASFARDAGFAAPEELIGKDDFQMGWRAQAEKYRADDRAVIETECVRLCIEEEQTTPTGETLTLLTSKLPLRDARGEIRGVLGAYMDITAHKQSERALQLALQVSGAGAWDWDMTTDRLSWSPEMFRLFGLDPAADSAGFETWRNRVHPEDLSGAEDGIRTAVRDHNRLANSYRISLPTGKVRWIHAVGDTTYNASHQAQRMTGMCIDITELKRAETEMERSHSLLTNLARLVPGVVYQYRLYPDGHSCFPYASPGMSDIYEVTPEEVREDATPVFGRLHPDDYDHVATAIQESARTLQLFRCEFRVVLPRQGLRWRWSQAHPSRTADGGTLWYGTIQDITELKRNEAELQKLDKLQSIGTLAGGIAHDFNNILLGLYGNLSIAMDDIAKDHPGYAPLVEAERSMLRAVRLTKQLLTFAKGGAPVTEDVSLGELAEEVARFDLSGSNVSLSYRQAGDLWPAQADKGQFQQVISNLVINARQAMPNGGQLTVTLENVEIPTDTVPTLRAGRYVKVSVRDEGGGIDPKMLNQIFDPYFTTKQSGSGLGLATVWSIVNKHGGHIDVESELGKGTTFTFYLPASASLLAAGTAAPAAERTPSIQKARILVMDDEEMIRDLVTSMLERCGHTVETAADGQEAIALYRKAMADGTPFKLVIMDLTIPGGMGGLEAVKLLRAMDPHVRAIVSSGYADDAAMANPALYGFDGTAAKPYTLRELREVVARVLAAT